MVDTTLFPTPFPSETFDYKKQSVIIPNNKPDQSDIYVSALMPNGFIGAPGYPKTTYECFSAGLSRNKDADCLGQRVYDPQTKDWAKEYTYYSFGDVDAKRSVYGSALVKLAEQQSFDWYSSPKTVGIWCNNRPEWQFVSLGASAFSIPVVSLYDTLGPNVVEYCINHAECHVIFTTGNHLAHLLKLDCPTIKAIVLVDSWDFIDYAPPRPSQATSKEVFTQWGKSKNITILDVAQFEAITADALLPHRPPTPSDTAMICYTSGTTGNPKGAVLLHQQLANAAISHCLFSGFIEPQRLISYLPLSHIYERFTEDLCFACGHSIAYSCGDNTRLLEDIALSKPSLFLGVPRVLNRIYQALYDATLGSPGLKGALIRRGFAAKQARYRATGDFTHPLWDKLLFNKVKAVLGGRIVYIANGSAPISRDLPEFFKLMLSTDFVDGYGSTENCATATAAVPGDTTSEGTVGPPIPGVEIILVDVPDMGYRHTDKPNPRGEICTRRGGNFGEYYKDPEKTKETIDEDGWLHTGDVGEFDAYGRLKIIDRIKNLAKLSQGEYVAIEKVENVYALCPLIAQVFVHGDPLKDHIVAIIVPDPDALSKLAAAVYNKPVSLKDVIEDEKLKSAVARTLHPYAAKAALPGYERIETSFAFELEPFSIENGMLTPTLKAKRNEIVKVYEKKLKALYEIPRVKVSAKI